MAKKVWMYNLKKEPSPKIPELIKAQVKSKAIALTEDVLKPKYI